MEIKTAFPKYSVGDIIQLNTNPLLKRKIAHIFTAFYDDIGINKEIYYQTVLVEDNNNHSIALSEKTINKFYTKNYEYSE